MGDKASVSVAAIVVTFNRKQLLARCLDRLLSQSRLPDKIILVDNASTDGTADMLKAQGYLDREQVELVRMTENSGGAGGFHAGIEHALKGSCDWFWLMDDDAIPEPDALQGLLSAPMNKQDIYASAAVFADDQGRDVLCWPAVIEPGNDRDEMKVIRLHADLDEVQRVRAIPFLGFTVNRFVVEQIGLPNKDFFISGDDIDYGERAKRAGARIFLVKASRLQHPSPPNYDVSFLGFQFFCLRLDPWRRYYDIRNRVLVARAHFGARFWTQTVPGLMVRLVATLWHEPDRLRQVRAYWKGMSDGIRGRAGKRVEPGSL